MSRHIHDKSKKKNKKNNNNTNENISGSHYDNGSCIIYNNICMCI